MLDYFERNGMANKAAIVKERIAIITMEITE
jgi:hypothetical protein